jgi:hypothetical protein
MESKNSKKSSERIEKATTFLTKLWWFFAFLIGIPLTIATVSYFIIQYIIKDVYFSIGLSIIVYMFSIFFFYKSFDQYRKKPLFLNNQNNFSARIHILFIVSILALIVTPIFIYVAPAGYYFELFPLISFCLLYNIIYYYYYYQPVEYFDVSESKFKRKLSFKSSLKQFHNIVILINFIIHVFFLTYTYYTKLSWLFTLITNIFFYFFTLLYTNKLRKRIRGAIEKDKLFQEHLLKFKQKFSVSVISLSFLLLIQLPFDILLINILSGVLYTNLDYILFAFVSIIFIFLYLKLRVFISINYRRKLLILEENEPSNSNQEPSDYLIRYQKWNMILSLFFSVFIFLFSLGINFPIIVLISFPAIIISTYFEQKANYCPKKYSCYIFLSSSVILLGSIIFWILPSFFDTLSLEIQLITFLVSLYLDLQIFIQYDYFDTNKIIFILVITYSFYPIISSIYFDFLIEPLLINIVNILFYALLSLLSLLGTFYYLYFRYFRKNQWKSFNLILNITIISIEILLFALISLKIFISMDVIAFINYVLVFTILLPLIFDLFIGFNYILGINTAKKSFKQLYSSSWILVLMIFTFIFYFTFNNFIFLIADLLYLSALSQILLKFGEEIDQISHETFSKVMKFNSVFIIIEISCLIFSISYINFAFIGIINNILLSCYITLIFNAILCNILKEKLFSKSIVVLINEICLLFTTGLTFYYLYQYTFGSYYIYVLPILFSSLFFFLPIYYTKSLKKYPNLIKNITTVASIVFSISLSLIPTILSLEFVRLGKYVDLITIFNLTAFIIYGILLFIIAFSRKLKIREKRIKLVLIIQILIEFILAVTAVFYYVSIALKGTLFEYSVPLVATSAFLFIPFIFLYKKQFIGIKINKLLLFSNFIFLWGSIISIPSIYSIEFFRLGNYLEFYYMLIIIIVLFYGFLKFLYPLSKYIEIKDTFNYIIYTLQIFTWFIITIAISLIIPFNFLIQSLNWLNTLVVCSTFLLFFGLNIINLPQIENFKQIVFENKKSKLDFYKIYKIYEYYKNIIYFGLIFSVSSLIYSLIQSLNLPYLIFQSSNSLMTISFDLGIFSGISLIIFHLSNLLIEIEFRKTKEIIEALLWLAIKFNLLLIISLFPFQISIINRIFLIILIFTVLSPITIKFFRNHFIILEETYLNTKKIIGILFFISLLGFFLDFLWNIYINVPYFWSNTYVLLSLIISIAILFSNYFFSVFNDYIEKRSELNIYGLYFQSFLIFIILLFMNTGFSLVLLVIIFIILYRKRIRNIYLRLANYLVGSYVCLIVVNIFIISFDLLSTFIYIHPGFYVCFYILSFILVLFISIILNIKKINILEEYLLDLLIPSLIFTSILIFNLIPLFYNITVSVAILLVLLSIFFYRQEDKRYIWFIRPCALLFLFDLISISSYFIIFSLPLYYEYNLILSSTLTFSIIGFCFALFFHDLRGKLKRRLISIILILSVASSFTFSYLLLKISFSLTLSDIYPWIIAGNIAIILSYIAIGIYQWKISWAIWKAGYWIWIFTPIINYLIIAESFTEINIYTNALNFFGIPIYGSHLIAFVICLLISLPFWYTWIKEHFNQVLFIIWGLSLFLIYWFSQNAFFGSTFLINLSFVGISIIFLMPIFYRLRLWKILSILWLAFTSILTIFVSYLFLETKLGLDMIISMDLILIGFLFIIFSFFPNIRALKNIVLIIAYSIAITGIFLTILNLIFSITYNLPVSINISFIIIAFSLFTSRILKLNRKLFNFLISTILTINFSLLTFFTFSLIPNFELFALFFAISVCGGSLLIFNRYRMISPIKKIIPLMILSTGVALTLSSLIYIFIPNSFFIVSATFIAIILLLNYPTLKYIRHILLYLVPIPFCLIILHFLSLIGLFQPLLNLILIGLILYTSIFQIFTYLKYGTVKIVNLLSFILNSTYLSLLITILSPVTILYQILEFCIIWSILIIFCINYLERTGQELVKEKTISTFLRISSLITVLLYFEIAVLIFVVLNEFLVLEITINIVAFFGTLFLLSFLDIILLKRVNKKIIYPLNILSYLFISISFFIFFNQFLAINVQLIFLNLIILFTLQFYTVYIIFAFLKQYESFDKDKLSTYRKIIQTIQVNIIFFIMGLFGSSYFTTLILDSEPILSGLPSIFLFLMIFTFILFTLNHIVRNKFRQHILFGYYIIFFINFAFFWVSFIIIFNLINTLSISLLLFTITILISYLVYSVGNIYKEKVKIGQINKIYSLIIFFLYLEISIILFGLSYIYLNIFESILISQTALFLISIIEIYVIRKIKTASVLILHTISYFNISWSLFVIIFQFTQNLFDLNLILFILMQFYTNHSYFITRSNFDLTKEPEFKKWKLIRQKITGSIFYLTLLLYILNYLLLAITEIQLVILILGVIIHGLMYIDKFIFKFLAELSKYVIIFSFFLILGTSILYSLGWVFIFSFQIIPLIILLVLLEITYLLKLFELWDVKKVNFSKTRNPLINLYYLNFLIWPFFYLGFEIFSILAIMLIFSIILIFLSVIDIRINAVNQKLRITILKTGYIMFVSLLSLEIFFFLEFIIQPNLLFNFSVSGLFFLITIGFIIKPFKRHRALSFFYWLSIFSLISLIIYFAYLSGWSFTLLLVGIVLYPFIFMLEELKELFSHLLEYLHKFILKIKRIISFVYRKFIIFLKNNFRIIQIILCIFIGVITGITFSDMVLNILNLYHATLLSLATFGIAYAITDFVWYHTYVKKVGDIKQIFRQKLKIFIIIWISFSSFIFALILPIIESILYQIFLVLIPFWGLGAILIWVVNRKEAKEKISVKVRFFITLSTIILFIVWIGIILLWYFTEGQI